MNAPTNIRVWLVRERCYPKGTEQDLFILATSLTEALEVVGTAPGREMILVQEVCPVTQTSADKWRVQPVTPPKP